MSISDNSNNEIMVSIICNVYNHENYLRDCLNGFIKQKTNFSYEVLVHDDASTDNSANIIREYENKYPDLIKPIYQTENQYSKGGVSRFQYPRVKGKYIALCEGDDYWISSLKLQKQVEQLEKNSNVDICAHAASAVDATTGNEIWKMAPRVVDDIIPVEDVIMGEGGFVATNSLMYRASLNEMIPEFRKEFPYDYAIQIHGSLHGGMLFLADNMSVYRYKTPGSWTVRQKNDASKQQIHFENKQKMLKDLDKYSDYRFHRVIEKRLKMNEFYAALGSGQYNALIQPRYKDIFDALPCTQRLKIEICNTLPFIPALKQRIQALFERIRVS